MSERADAEPAREVDGRRMRWIEHRARRRAGFVAAGVTAIDEYGPSASAEQIAETAEVSRSVLYRYFRDRDDLCQAISDQIVEEVIGCLAPHLMIAREATPRQIVVPAIGAIIDWLDEHPNLYHFLRERRNGSADAVESTLTNRVAALFKAVLTMFGVGGEQAAAGAYGIVGLVESSGTWWLAQRTMSRERFTAVVCELVWFLLEGAARAAGITVGYDDPLPDKPFRVDIDRAVRRMAP